MNRSTFLVRIAMLCTFSFLWLADNTLHAQNYPAYALINAYAGKGSTPLNASRFDGGITVDLQGNYYYTYADVQSLQHQVIKMDGVTKTETVIAGGAAGFFGDGGDAINAQFNLPTGIVTDSKGNLYIADRNNFRIRKIDKLTNQITTIAGTGVADVGLPGENQPAISSVINADQLAIDKQDNIYFTDPANKVVRKIDAQTGILTTVAGSLTGGSGDFIPATQASFFSVNSLALDDAGNIYIGLATGIKKVTKSTGIINNIVTRGNFRNFLLFYENIPAADMELPASTPPRGLAVDKAGNVYFSLINAPNNSGGNFTSVYKLNAALQTVTTAANTNGESGFFGNGVPATAARLSDPNALLVDSSNNLVIAQRNAQVLRTVNLGSGIITNLTSGKGEVFGDIGDGQNADSAQFNTPRDIAVDADGNIYIADGLNQRIRKIDKLTHIITTVAGTGEAGFSGDGGQATDARLSDPTGIAFDNQGNLLFADRNNKCIRKIDKQTGVITTIAGRGITGQILGGIGGLAVNASFVGPTDVVVDKNGNIYFSTAGDFLLSNIVFKITTNGIIQNFAGQLGTPTRGYSGDNGQANAARLFDPHGLAIDANGNLFIADKGNNVIRKVDAQTNIITTVAGTGTAGQAGNGGLATSAQLSAPDDLSFDPQGNLVIADLGNNQVRLLDMTSNRLHTIAGTGTAGYSGNGGPAINASLNQVSGIAIAANGVTYVADQVNNRIRIFQPLAQGPLPVTLINFRAAANGQDALLQWSTTSEQNTASFNIERSANGNNNWQTIGTVAAAGNSSALLNYTFTDNNTFSGINYYRLRLIDLDGTTAYSPVIMLNFRSGLQQEFAVYPNPVRDHVTVTLASKANSTAVLKIISASGAVQRQQSVQLKTGNNIFTLNDVSSLGAGIYFLQVTVEGSNTPMVKKLLKM